MMMMDLWLQSGAIPLKLKPIQKSSRHWQNTQWKIKIQFLILGMVFNLLRYAYVSYKNWWKNQVYWCAGEFAIVVNWFAKQHINFLDFRLLPGGEAILWSDLVSSSSLDDLVWPRAAAVAERLWSDVVLNAQLQPEVYFRLDSHRWRMVLRGECGALYWLHRKLVLISTCLFFCNIEDHKGFLWMFGFIHPWCLNKIMADWIMNDIDRLVRAYRQCAIAL